MTNLMNRVESSFISNNTHALELSYGIHSSCKLLMNYLKQTFLCLDIVIEDASFQFTCCAKQITSMTHHEMEMDKCKPPTSNQRVKYNGICL